MNLILIFFTFFIFMSINSIEHYFFFMNNLHSLANDIVYILIIFLVNITALYSFYYLFIEIVIYFLVISCYERVI
jgi:hypothetical protein